MAVERVPIKRPRPTFDGVKEVAERKGYRLFRNTKLGAYNYAKSKLPPFGIEGPNEVRTFRTLTGLLAWLETANNSSFSGGMGLTIT